MHGAGGERGGRGNGGAAPAGAAGAAAAAGGPRARRAAAARQARALEGAMAELHEILSDWESFDDLGSGFEEAVYGLEKHYGAAARMLLPDEEALIARIEARAAVTGAAVGAAAAAALAGAMAGGGGALGGGGATGLGGGGGAGGGPPARAWTAAGPRRAGVAPLLGRGREAPLLRARIPQAQARADHRAAAAAAAARRGRGPRAGPGELVALLEAAAARVPQRVVEEQIERIHDASTSPEELRGALFAAGMVEAFQRGCDGNPNQPERAFGQDWTERGLEVVAVEALLLLWVHPEGVQRGLQGERGPEGPRAGGHEACGTAVLLLRGVFTLHGVRGLAVDGAAKAGLEAWLHSELRATYPYVRLRADLRLSPRMADEAAAFLKGFEEEEFDQPPAGFNPPPAEFDQPPEGFDQPAGFDQPPAPGPEAPFYQAPPPGPEAPNPTRKRGRAPEEEGEGDV
ncbi:hypothetical protein Rsub_04518 [Raphidocelis subcapitata]|uniref:Uncharacterized protein n=1 Tax=Raphidocelis subcapitata TaxID=307507 RepID=A0A2V0NXR0_9CHLO|nr:hypothetical protein Rsub_04518 [Raphidocelis subcapitata]|eukprot:GBF92414.1 hypothetical protein Rsub_04518 [Raphidocelis subcapitata]